MRFFVINVATDEYEIRWEMNPSTRFDRMHYRVALRRFSRGSYWTQLDSISISNQLYDEFRERAISGALAHLEINWPADRRLPELEDLALLCQVVTWGGL